MKEISTAKPRALALLALILPLTLFCVALLAFFGFKNTELSYVLFIIFIFSIFPAIFLLYFSIKKYAQIAKSQSLLKNWLLYWIIAFAGYYFVKIEFGFFFDEQIAKELSDKNLFSLVVSKDENFLATRDIFIFIFLTDMIFTALSLYFLFKCSQKFELLSGEKAFMFAFFSSL